MKYTIKDLKNGKVILKNTNDKKTKEVLKKAFNVKFESYEDPAYTYFFADKNSIDGYNAFNNIDITDQSTWCLNLDGTITLPDYLKGYTSMLKYYKIENLPIQDVKNFKI